jgi:hypothetical protein
MTRNLLKDSLFAAEKYPPLEKTLFPSLNALRSVARIPLRSLKRILPVHNRLPQKSQETPEPYPLITPMGTSFTTFLPIPAW